METLVTGGFYRSFSFYLDGGWKMPQTTDAGNEPDFIGKWERGQWSRLPAEQKFWRIGWFLGLLSEIKERIRSARYEHSRRSTGNWSAWDIGQMIYLMSPRIIWEWGLVFCFANQKPFHYPRHYTRSLSEYDLAPCSYSCSIVVFENSNQESINTK